MRIFENPFRLIHELYVWKVWFKSYRQAGTRPELNDAWNQKERNLNTLLMQFYIAVSLFMIATTVVLFVFGDYEIVKIVDVPIGIRT